MLRYGFNNHCFSLAFQTKGNCIHIFQKRKATITIIFYKKKISPGDYLKLNLLENNKRNKTKAIFRYDISFLFISRMYKYVSPATLVEGDQKGSFFNCNYTEEQRKGATPRF